MIERDDRAGGCLRPLVLVAVAVTVAGLLIWGMLWAGSRWGGERSDVAVLDPVQEGGAPGAFCTLPDAADRESFLRAEAADRAARRREIAPPTAVEAPQPRRPPASPPASPPRAEPSSGDPVTELLDRRLTVPVQGVGRSELMDTYQDPRSGDRTHQAIDIMAPRNRPVLAVDDGVIAKVFRSDLGGKTLYQFDGSGRYSFYYAHLERYARGIEEGDEVSRGQVIGYVGTSGNAPDDAPHLHFAIYRLNEDRRWWEGEPINPYPVLAGTRR